MASSYYNLNNVENTPTSFIVPFSDNVRFIDLDPSFDTADTKMSYTEITCELPMPIDNDGNEITSYWSSLGYSDFTTSVRFQTRVPFVAGTLAVFIDGEENENITIEYQPGSTIIGTRFSFNTSPGNNHHLYVSYIPSSPSYFLGNRISTVTAIAGIKHAAFHQERVRTVNLVRIRKIINNLENYFISAGEFYAPTLWIGGPTNTSRSSSDSLIPGVSDVYYSQIVEIQNSIRRMETFISSSLNITHSACTLDSGISYDSKYMVNYIEQLMTGVYQLELRMSSNNI